MRFLVYPLFVASVAAAADERFYPTYDAQGRVQVIQGHGAAPSKQEAKTPAVPEPVAPAPEQKAPAKTTAVKGVRQLDQENYLDSEVLEKKNFNPDDKKRFYYLPDGSIGSKVVEMKDGLATPAAPALFAPVARTALMAAAYQTLEPNSLQQMYGWPNQCVDSRYLKKHQKPFKDKNSVWLKSAWDKAELEPDAVLALPATTAVEQLRIESFATTHKTPAYYLPVTVFLDDKGCLLGGAWHYWSQAYPANDKQYASVDGLLIMPVHSAYILFYRPTETLQAGIPMSRDAGSFVVEVYAKRSP